MYTHRTPRNTQLKQASATSNREEEIEKIKKEASERCPEGRTSGFVEK